MSVAESSAEAAPGGAESTPAPGLKENEGALGFIAVVVLAPLPRAPGSQSWT